jgi:hypothetical protein
MSEDYSKDSLLLKWGSLKGWHLENPETFDLLKKWGDLGVSMSAMAQNDTPEQKEILCELIRKHTGTITNDWDGEDYSKERAIDYIMNYGAAA